MEPIHYVSPELEVVNEAFCEQQKSSKTPAYKYMWILIAHKSEKENSKGGDSQLTHMYR